MSKPVIFEAKGISQYNSVGRPKEMEHKWEGEWKGERIYIEVDTAPFAEAIVKSFFLGLLGRAKSKCLMQYGNQIVDRCEIEESLDSIDEMYGRLMQPDGQEAYFHAWITTKIGGPKCELEINNEKVRIHAVE